VNTYIHTRAHVPLNTYTQDRSMCSCKREGGGGFLQLHDFMQTLTYLCVCVCVSLDMYVYTRRRVNLNTHTYAHSVRIYTSTRVLTYIYRSPDKIRQPLCCSVFQRVAVCCRMLLCIAVCYCVLQCVAVCCSAH